MKNESNSHLVFLVDPWKKSVRKSLAGKQTELELEFPPTVLFPSKTKIIASLFGDV
jgi:hypothetical protein